MKQQINHLHKVNCLAHVISICFMVAGGWSVQAADAVQGRAWIEPGENVDEPAPLANARVWLAAGEDFANVVASTRTDTQGHYRFLNLYPGQKYAVIIERSSGRNGIYPVRQGESSALRETLYSEVIEGEELALAATDWMALDSKQTLQLDAGFKAYNGNVTQTVDKVEVCCGEPVTFTMLTRMLTGGVGNPEDNIMTNIFVSNSYCGVMGPANFVGADFDDDNHIQWYDPGDNDSPSLEVWTNTCVTSMTESTTVVAYDRFDWYELVTPLFGGESFYRFRGEEENFSTVEVAVVESAPVILTTLLDETVECGEPIPAPPTVIVSNDCAGMTSAVPLYSEIVLEEDCPVRRIIRVWTATNLCGITSSASQTITVVDTSAPIWDGQNPADPVVQLSCGESIDDWQPVPPDAVDACDSNVIVTSGDLEDLGIEGCEHVYEVIWTAEDSCSNMTTQVQQIRVPLPTDIALSASISPASVYAGGDALLTVIITNKSEFPVMVQIDNSVLTGCNTNLGPIPAGMLAQYDCNLIGLTENLTNVVTVTAGDRGCCAATAEVPVEVEVIPLASIGDRVWYDENRDGLQTPGETGISNVTVILWQDSPLATNVTDSSGNYLFEDLIPGDYRIQFILSTLPANTEPTIQDEGGNDSVDSDADPASGFTMVTTLDPGENDPDWDLGVVDMTASLGDLVWFDMNRDGLQTPGEPGVSNLTVTLLDTNGVERLTTTTDGNGNYRFDDLIPGFPYVVRFELGDIPTGFEPTDPNNPDDDLRDSDGDPLTGLSHVIVLDPQEHDPGIDFGIVPLPASLGDQIWVDFNTNGIREVGEPPFFGSVIVRLLDGEGAEVDQLLTTDGTYLFTNLPAGTYQVEFEIPADQRFTMGNVGDDAFDSDVMAGSNDLVGVSHLVVLNPGENDPTVDVGLVPVPPTNPVIIVNPAIQLIKTVSDNGTCPGEKSLDNLIPGTGIMYCFEVTNIGDTRLDGIVVTDQTLSVTLPVGTLMTNESITVQTGIRSADANLTNVAVVGGNSVMDDGSPWPEETIFQNGPHVTDTNEASVTVMILGSLSGQVRDDFDGDGDPTDGDTGLAGVEVLLFTQGGVLVTSTVTDADGHYRFDNLIPGEYVVVESDLANWTSTGDVDGGDPNIISAVVLAGNESMNNDFLDTLPAELHGQVRLDADADGDMGDSDSPISGVTIRLYRDNNHDGEFTEDELVGTTVTDENGSYSFVDLIPGEFLVIEEDPAGHTSSADIVGANDNQIPVTLASRQVSTGNDFLDTRGVTIGNFVWEDSNGNGLQDAGEMGVAGVTVFLLDEGGAVIDSTVTDADGFYSFSQLPGEYGIQFDLSTLPAGYQVTAPNLGSDLLNSDGDPATGQTRSTGLLEAGQSDLNLDLGIWLPGSIGDTIWEDPGADGVEENDNLDNLGLIGVDVQLFRIVEGGEVLVGTTTTTTNGYYLFPNLPPATYVVRVNTSTVPAELTDITTTPLEYTIALTSGQAEREADFGFRQEETSVDLVAFSASTRGTDVLIGWTTGSERNNLGFNIYRGRRADGSGAVQINPSLIRGRNHSLRQADYVYLDEKASEAGIYYYFLADVDASGDRTVHGPASVLVGEAQILHQAVAEAGIYLIDVDTPSETTVYVHGQEVASFVLADSILFYVDQAAEVQLVQSANPLRMESINAAPTEGPDFAADAIDGELQLDPSPEFGTVQLNGFNEIPIVLDLGDASSPVLLLGEAQQQDDGSFSMTIQSSGHRIHAAELK